MNALVDYIKTRPDWRKELVEKPFCLTIKDDGPYTIFSYSQIDSDFSERLVCESRGIILRNANTDPVVVCQAYNKFFNYNDPLCAKIDWATAKIQSKIDGSIIRYWWDSGAWHISTNGVIDAFKTDLMNPTDEFKTFGDLVLAAEKMSGLDRNKLITSCVYIMELVGPWNRVVVPYKETTLWHTGTRNMLTGEEVTLDIGVQKPEEYSFDTWDEMIETTKTLPFDKEGYVVVDANWNRAKCKGLSYLACHRLKNNGNVNPDRVVELIKLGDDQEFISYFPEYKEHFDRIKAKYDLTIAAINLILSRIPELRQSFAEQEPADERKRRGLFAAMANGADAKVRKFYFAYYDGNEEKVKKMIADLDYDDLL